MTKTCRKCNKTKDIDEFQRSQKSADGRDSQCKVCQHIYANAYHEKNRAKINAQARVYLSSFVKDPRNRKKLVKKGRVWRLSHPVETMLALTKSRAKKKGIAFSLTLEDIRIPRFCPVLKFKLEHGQRASGKSPSLDRILPNRGYVKDNVQVMSSKANVMKNNATPAQLLCFAEWIMKTYGAKRLPRNRA